MEACTYGFDDGVGHVMNLLVDCIPKHLGIDDRTKLSGVEPKKPLQKDDREC
jgi:hypothetical protein